MLWNKQNGRVDHFYDKIFISFLDQLFLNCGSFSTFFIFMKGYRLKNIERCAWCLNDPLYMEYHDKEWGKPLHDDRLLFEFLILEGAQAGLSWLTVLKKRDNYRKAFDYFNPQIIAKYDDKKIKELLNNAGIIRNRLKITSAIRNAQAFLDVQKQFDSFDKYIWQFVDGIPRNNNISTIKDLPSKTLQSDAMSKDLKKRGFTFVGSTICYAFMQATGMINDHTISCHFK